MLRRPKSKLGASVVKLGFLTACLPGPGAREAIADWAAAHDFQALEVAIWPRYGQAVRGEPHRRRSPRPGRGGADRRLSGGKGLEISALAYYENNLHPDEQVREQTRAHLRSCVDAARLLGCRYVGHLRREGLEPYGERERQARQRVTRRLSSSTRESADIGLIIENCPMEGWHPDGYPGNLAYSPELWEWMFSLGFYLNYDPSHLTWLGIDPIVALRSCPERIVHAQAKDVEIDPAARNQVGAVRQGAASVSILGTMVGTVTGSRGSA